MSDLIEAHLAWMRAGGYADNTVEDAGKLLRMADRRLPFGVEQAADQEWETFFGHPGWSKNSRLTYFKHVRRFYEWACDPKRDGLDYNPIASLRRPVTPAQLPRPVSEQELATMLRAREPWRTCVLLAALAGLRCCEMAALQRGDVTGEVMTIHGKGGKIAPVETHPTLWEAIEPLPAGPVIRDRAGQPVSADWISSSAGLYFRQRLGLPKGVTLHRARHWFATRLLEDTDNLLLVKEALRHSSIQSTQGYALLCSARRRAAVTGLRLPAA